MTTTQNMTVFITTHILIKCALYMWKMQLESSSSHPIMLRSSFRRFILIVIDYF